MKQKFSWLVGLVLLFGLIGAFSFNPKASEILTQEQKEQYYQEYIKIAEELRAEYPNALTFNVSAIEEIEEKDWVKPEQYREKIIPIINEKKGIVELPFVSFDVNAPTKYKQIHSKNGDVLATIVINSTVSVAYDSKLGRPVINDICKAVSYTMTGFAYWGQKGSNLIKVDSQNYRLNISGNLLIHRVTLPDVLSVDYTFNKQGFIQ
ncbi:hypothetical protein JFL43_10460 [Viridibacillus sp. YIM B01967]|uniref:Uncharacterized protein n=1 Tax=Viridibacillus soli TaxID=2798301 RepID=A0ABS1H774_9BACL|nr:hypothetical protein [Viridibacillus soli]MBK3495266.1 hypothetical protein [Viridibacillus soli]